MKELLKNMLTPRKAKPLGVSEESWYYVGPSSIDIFIKQENCSTASARLTRKQLQRALEIMDEAASQEE